MLDQDQALDFYVGKLGFELNTDADLGFMRWLTVGIPGQDTSLLLELVGGPQHDDATAAQVRELVTKGALGGLFLTSSDVHATYAALVEAGTLTPAVDRTFPLTEARAAITYLETEHARSKVVLTVS